MLRLNLLSQAGLAGTDYDTAIVKNYGCGSGNGVVDVVFYGMAWYSLVWLGILWYGMAWYGMAIAIVLLRCETD